MEKQKLLTPERSFGLTANALRLLALTFMLLDHMWATVVTGNTWMTCVGRMAFPIFAFQISEGFLHTSDFRRYAGRLLIFALVSEIPFNYMIIGSPVFPFHQNVMFTLLLGLMAIRSIDRARAQGGTGAALRSVGITLLCVLAGTLGFVDYGGAGVATVVLFYLCRGFRGAWLCQLAGMILLNCYVITGMDLPLTLFGREFFFPQQGFAVFALVFIWLYNGRRGIRSRALQYAAYAFYPVHMAVLYLILKVQSWR